MKKSLLAIILLSSLFSCAVKEDGPETQALRITAEMTEYTDMVFLQDSHIWNETDQIAIYATEGNGTPAIAKPISVDAQTSRFVFNLPLHEGDNTLAGVYPHDAAVTVTDGQIRFDIPQNQTGKIMSLQAGKTIYRSGSYQDGRITLTPLYKVINVRIGRGNRTVKSIKVTATDGSLISGEVCLDIASWRYRAMSGSVNVTLSKALDCREGSVSVPVMVADTDAKGYEAIVTTVEGETFTTGDIFDGYGPKELSYELGVSQALFGSLSQAEASSMIKAGVKYLEVTMNTFWRDQTEEECQKRFESTKNIISNTPGLEVWSVHLPFSGSLDISLTDDTRRATNVELMAKMIRMAGEFKPKKLVLHPSSEPISESEREERLKCAKESIGKLLPVAKEIGAQLCIENLPRTCLGRHSSEMLFLIKDYPEVMVCFDSNHLLIETHNSFFKAVGDRIGTIHASDYDKTDERHWVPGKGVIDWPAFLTSLMHYGYDGVFMTEVKSATLDEVCRSYTDVICKTK